MAAAQPAIEWVKTTRLEDRNIEQLIKLLTASGAALRTVRPLALIPASG